MDIVAHFIALLQAVLVFVFSNKLIIRTKLFEIILNFRVSFIRIYRSIEFNNVRLTTSNLAFNISLNATHLFPLIIILSPIKCIHKSNFCNYLNVFIFESYQSNISVIYWFLCYLITTLSFSSSLFSFQCFV